MLVRATLRGNTKHSERHTIVRQIDEKRVAGGGGGGGGSGGARCQFRAGIFIIVSEGLRMRDGRNDKATRAIQNERRDAQHRAPRVPSFAPELQAEFDKHIEVNAYERVN